MSHVYEEPMNWITEDVIRKLVVSYDCLNEDIRIENYIVTKASDKMLGFLADYWKLQVHLSFKEKKNTLYFFIKAVSQIASKADMVRELKLFEKEIDFYAIVKKSIQLADVKPWSAKLVTAHKEAIVLEDMNALGYKSVDKFKTFDDKHTQEALHMLARFHACSIIYEQKKRKAQQSYSIDEEFSAYLDKGGYDITSVWFDQCMRGALAAVKKYSKYKNDGEIMSVIESRWKQVWSSALDLSNPLSEHCNVVCHRDLWNNNILFHYKNINGQLVPDDCLMVDFQAVRCQPPAGDVMLLLYCNLNTKYREDNMDGFLSFYHKKLEIILSEHGINICDVLSLQNFLQSAAKQRLWALIVTACLVPQMWLHDDLTTDIFSDTKQFNDILCHDKASFIKRMIEINDQYRVKVMHIFEEIVDRYCIVQDTCKIANVTLVK